MILQSFIPLLAPVLLGFVCGWVNLFRDTQAVIRGLNRFALFVAFPVLIFGSLQKPGVVLPSGWGFYVGHVVAFLICLTLLTVVCYAVPRFKKTYEPALFGILLSNIGYLGIPFCERYLGEEYMGIVAVSASTHIVCVMVLSPLAMMVFGSRTSEYGIDEIPRQVVQQPLIWAAIVGVIARRTIGPLGETIHAPFAGIGHCAAPVGLFILGLYLYLHRDSMVKLEDELRFMSIGKLIVLPVIFGVTAVLLRNGGYMTDGETQVFVLMAAMPSAVSTFPLACEYNAREQLVARAIVVTTALSVVTLPVMGFFFA